MTFHTRAATDEIYNIFNQPLKLPGMQEDEAADGAETDEDDCTSAGENTTTGRVSVASETYGDEVAEALTSSQWTDFTARKHIPDVYRDRESMHGEEAPADVKPDHLEIVTRGLDRVEPEPDRTLVTPTSPRPEVSAARPTFIPMPPEDYEPPRRPYRELQQSCQGRLPFMTPIDERTESSLALSMKNHQHQQELRMHAKTPSKGQVEDDLDDATADVADAVDCDLMSSPFQEIINEAVARHKRALQPMLTKSAKRRHDDDDVDQQLEIPAVTEVTDETTDEQSGFCECVIGDEVCNPTAETIRRTILEQADPPLSTYPGFFDRQGQYNGKSREIRKFIRASTAATRTPKGSGSAQDKQSSNPASGPFLRFDDAKREYIVKRELGKGAFAPVYLVEGRPTRSEPEDEDSESLAIVHDHRSKLEAMKMEDPPTAWEFYIMRQAAYRLDAWSSSASPRHGAISASIVRAHELHLFEDECFLVEDYRDQGTLLDLINLAKHDCTLASSSSSTMISSSPTSGTMDELLVMFFAIEIFRVVEALHANGIIHGDLKADNCLLRLEPVDGTATRPKADGATFSTALSDTEDDEEPWTAQYHRSGERGWDGKGIALIDFGRGIDMHAFRPDVAFIADWPTGPEDCVEMRQGRAWTYQIDYHGLAGIIHTMLFGKYIDTAVIPTPGMGATDARKADEDDPRAAPAIEVYKIADKFKRYWQVELWTDVFDVLLNPLLHTAAYRSHPHRLRNAAPQEDGSSSSGSHVPNGCEEDEHMPILHAMRRVRSKLEDHLESTGHHASASSGSHGRVSIKELLERVERRIISHRGSTAKSTGAKER